jgi:hypothetical protein
LTSGAGIATLTVKFCAFLVASTVCPWPSTTFDTFNALFNSKMA